MSKLEAPEQLLKFFESLDAGGPDTGACELHYACRCTVEKGRRAARMLVEIQKLMGIESPEPPAKTAGSRFADEIGPIDHADEVKMVMDALAEERARYDGLLRQNLKLADENISLRQKVQALRGQVNRLYDNREMLGILKRINPSGQPGDHEAGDREAEEAHAEAKDDDATPLDAIADEAGMEWKPEAPAGDVDDAPRSRPATRPDDADK